MKNKVTTSIFLIIPIIIIIAVSIYLVYVLRFNFSQDKYTDYRQTYEKLKVNEEDIVRRYISQLSDSFKKSDLSKILSIIDMEDEKYAAMGSGDLLDILNENKILGNSIELVKYEKYDAEGMGKTYDTYVKVENSDEVKNIVIKETYPDEYTVVLGF